MVVPLPIWESVPVPEIFVAIVSALAMLITSVPLSVMAPLEKNVLVPFVPIWRVPPEMTVVPV